MVCFLCVIVDFIPYIDDYHHHGHDGDKFFNCFFGIKFVKNFSILS